MEEIELRELFYIVWKRIWIILLITVLCLVTSGIVSFFVLEDEYSTSTTLMVGKPKDYNEDMNYQDILLNQKLVSTYSEIAKSRIVLNEVVETLELEMSSGALSGKINVSLVRDTEIIKISVNDNDPELAARIANVTASIFKKHVSRIMKIDNVQVIDKAVVPVSPVKPRPMLNIAIAGVLGGMLSVFIVFILEYLDNTIKTPEEVEKYLELPVIGMIPHTES